MVTPLESSHQLKRLTPEKMRSDWLAEVVRLACKRSHYNNNQLNKKKRKEKFIKDKVLSFVAKEIKINNMELPQFFFFLA